MQPSVTRTATARRLLAFSFVSLVAVYLAWAAFHDITQGEADVTTEYVALCLCAAWFAYLGTSLILHHHGVLGRASLVALALAVWGQQDIGAGTRASWSPSYLATIVPFLWFLALTVVLAVLGWRAPRQREASQA